MLRLDFSPQGVQAIALTLMLGALTAIASAQTSDGQVTTASKTKEIASTSPIPSPERWDQLSINPLSLVASAPIVGEKEAHPDFTRELLRLQWRNGDPIDIYVIRPSGVKNPPIVLYLYGYPSETDRFLNNELCENLTKNGFAAVGFVSALTGHRYHDRPLKEWFVSELQESLGASVHDVQMILNYLSTRGDLDMNRVGMFGQGSGGAIAVLAAAVDPRIKVVDVLDPWGDWPDWLATSPQVPNAERAIYLKPDFLTKVAPLDPITWLPKLADRPLRVQEDLFLPFSVATVREKFEATLPAGAISAEYKTQADYIEKVTQNARMLDWIKGQLTTPKPSPTELTLSKDGIAKGMSADRTEAPLSGNIPKVPQ